MEYKRLELYVWWTCNQKCTYCMEFPYMERQWTKKVSKYEILKYLIKYKKLWYNHVTYLWWEPFIQPVFLDALIIWKKLGYTILVTTNATTLHIDSQASKFLPYIDELILSVEAIDKDLQQKISRTNVYVRWDEVFENINRYWKWTYLKINIVITKDNLLSLFEIVKYLNTKKIKNIAITYPDIDIEYYWKTHVLDRVAPRYNECIVELIHIIEFCKKNQINIKLPDFPFCVFPKDNIINYIKLTDDYDYQTRLKIKHNWDELDRKDLIPRDRIYIDKCLNCLYLNKCWWLSDTYELIYWLDEINPITK